MALPWHGARQRIARPQPTSPQPCVAAQETAVSPCLSHAGVGNKPSHHTAMLAGCLQAVCKLSAMVSTLLIGQYVADQLRTCVNMDLQPDGNMHMRDLGTLHLHFDASWPHKYPKTEQLTARDSKSGKHSTKWMCINKHPRNQPRQHSLTLEGSASEPIRGLAVAVCAHRLPARLSSERQGYETRQLLML